MWLDVYMTTATAFTNQWDQAITVGTAGTAVIHRFLGNSNARYCNYSGQARRRNVGRLWDLNPGETVEGRLCQKCFGHLLPTEEVI